MDMDATHHFFIDETGDHGLGHVDRNFPLFMLAGCLIAHADLVKLELALNSLKMDFFGTTEVVLHSRDIRKCQGPFQALFDLDLKEKFYRRLNDAIGDADFIMLNAAVDKAKYIEKFGLGGSDPYAFSLSSLVERLMTVSERLGHGASVSINIENRGKREDATLLSHFNSLMDRGTANVATEKLRTVIADFSGSDKRDNVIGLQLVDLCAYPVARFILDQKAPNPSFEVFQSKIFKGPDNSFWGHGVYLVP